MIFAYCRSISIISFYYFQNSITRICIFDFQVLRSKFDFQFLRSELNYPHVNGCGLRSVLSSGELLSNPRVGPHPCIRLFGFCQQQNYHQAHEMNNINHRNNIKKTKQNKRQIRKNKEQIRNPRRKANKIQIRENKIQIRKNKVQIKTNQ